MGTPLTLSKFAIDTLVATFRRQGIEPNDINIRTATKVAYQYAAGQVFAEHDRDLLAKMVDGELTFEEFLDDESTSVAEAHETDNAEFIEAELVSFANGFYRSASYAEGMFDAMKQRPQTPLYAFNELPSKLQEQLRNNRLNNLLEAICEGVPLEVLGIQGELADKIVGAFDKAEAMRTPWFASEYIMEDAGDDLRAKVADDVASNLYLNSAAQDADVVVLGW